MSAPMTTVRGTCHICGTINNRSVRLVMSSIINRKCNGCHAIIAVDAWLFPDGIALSKAIGDITCAECETTFRGAYWQKICKPCYQAAKQ